MHSSKRFGTGPLVSAAGGARYGAVRAGRRPASVDAPNAPRSDSTDDSWTGREPVWSTSSTMAFLPPEVPSPARAGDPLATPTGPNRPLERNHPNHPRGHLRFVR